MLRKDGLGATNHFETGGFIRSRAGERYPDIQYHFLPMAVSCREIQPGAGVQTDAQKTSLSVDTWRVPITPRARAGWAASMTRWPWSIPKSA
jgi:choline dehydrogenase-like flavoprotein